MCSCMRMSTLTLEGVCSCMRISALTLEGLTRTMQALQATWPAATQSTAQAGPRAVLLRSPGSTEWDSSSSRRACVGLRLIQSTKASICSHSAPFGRGGVDLAQI